MRWTHTSTPSSITKYWLTCHQNGNIFFCLGQIKCERGFNLGHFTHPSDCDSVYTNEGESIHIPHPWLYMAKMYILVLKIYWLFTAIIQAGRGVTQFNSILGALNIPPIHHKMVVNRQAEIGPHIETVAKDSTEQSLEEENLLTGGYAFLTPPPPKKKRFFWYFALKYKIHFHR